LPSSWYAVSISEEVSIGKMTDITLPGNVEYVGDLRDGLMHGKGKLTNNCGDFRWLSYEGDFENNKANGEGIEEYSSLIWHVLKICVQKQEMF